MRSWFSGVGIRSGKRRQSARKARRSFQVENLEGRALLAALVHQGDLSYQGAFSVPAGEVGSSTFDYGGTALAYNPRNNSLFMVGHDWDQAIAEVSIPALGAGPIESLPTAEVLQPFTPVLNRLPNASLQQDDVKIGGLMVYGDQLIGSAFEFYDGDGNAVDSHFTLSTHDLDAAKVGGLYQVGELGGGYVGGYMAQVPSQWQQALGSKYLTGQAGLSIISRTSAGPAAFGFDPAQLGSGVAAATPLVYYPVDHAITDIESTNPLFNTTSQIHGVVFPEGTDSVLFIGSHGTGDYWYGEYNEGGYDPYRQDKGPHAPEYKYQVWAYDAHDLAAVKNGQKAPWEIQPYEVWNLDLPYAGGPTYIGGVAYDAASGQLYVSQQYANEGYPVVHAFKVGEPSRSAEGEVPAQAPTDITLASNTVAENAPVGTTVATLQSIDVNIGDTFTYTLVAGPGSEGNAAFKVVGDKLQTAKSLDFESQSQFYIRLRTTDLLGASFEKVVTINVTDVKEVPTDIALSNNTLAENQPAGTVVGTLRTTDPDAGDSFRYSLVSGTGSGDNWAFKVVGDKLVTAHSLNYEAKSRYSVRVRTTDAAGQSFEKSLVINVTDVNEAPVLTLSGSLGYQLNKVAVVLAPQATVQDVDSRDFAGGKLVVSVTQGADASNRLSLGGGFRFMGMDLMSPAGTKIGTLVCAGEGTKNLAMTFNANATRELVQELVRSITFRTVNGTSTATRTISFSLSDGDGGVSAVRTKTVNVRA